ncbi:MAG: hypothetical protein ACJZZ7_04495 [Cytophagales bacterium]|nr:MAG: hypothetical protein CNE34_02355 [Rhodothermaeota bacterium MED-G18]|tara:strand:- start:49 stop:594 length:546 start_codon:yes stop_codon:yes gene_type:complete
MNKNVIIAFLIGIIIINEIADYYETTLEEKLEIAEINIDNEIKKAEESKLINPLVNQLFSTYVKYWSDQDFNKISEEIYGVPFILYNQDEVTVFSTEDQVVSFLKNTFNQLEENNYGYSVTNSFEHYKEDDNIIIIEMNFTRFLKDGNIMGEEERKASYILKKIDGSFKIVALIPHSPIAE